MSEMKSEALSATETAQFLRPLDAAEAEEIAGLAVEAGETAAIAADLPPIEQVSRIRDFLETPESIDESQIRTLAFSMGSLFGVLIERTYGWSWGVVKFPDGEERYGVFSPDRRFAILPHELFFNHLSEAHVSNFVLLFGLLAKGTPKPRFENGVTLLA